MGGSFPPESSPSRLGFAADVASAAQALIRQPSVPVVSLAVMLLLQALPDGPTVVTAFAFAAAAFALQLFRLGWYGAERIFFQRQLEGRPVALPHLFRLVKPFVGRFLVLGVLCLTVIVTFFFALARVLGIAMPDHLTEANTTLPVKLIIALLALGADFSLTFVTPALAYPAIDNHVRRHSCRTPSEGRDCRLLPSRAG